MNRRFITEEVIKGYESFLKYEEKSRATTEKYIRDVRKLATFLEGRELTKELVIGFKGHLRECGRYNMTSINSYIDTINRFFEYMNWFDLKIKTYPMQKQSFQEDERHISRKEYNKLLNAARRLGKMRLYMMLICLGSTGIRVSELKFITAEAVRKGLATVCNKGKGRKVILTDKLCSQLSEYMKKEGISTGPIFITCHGNPVDRSNVWKEMKKLAEKAKVSVSRVFPHNLRKLFASCFYDQEKDIAKVAEVLGHSRLDTTRIYIRETAGMIRNVLERLELVMEPSWD
ncbi:MAG: site-specific integrase [Lachnospiraceae bacterium]|nr:site-specific integrase [Lachnospiraceae bacterium]